MKKLYLLLFFSLLLIGGGFAQTAISPVAGGNFDMGNTFAANGWTVVNSSANKWVVGTETRNSPPNSAYISATGNLDDYSYDNNSPHISHFYQKVTLPAEAFYVNLNFELKGTYQFDANGFLRDGFEIFADPSLTIPVPDQLPGGSAGIVYFPFGSTTNYANQGTTLDYLAGKSFYIIFTWINDGDEIGDGPPASVDGISLTYCIKATNYNVTGGGFFCTGSSGVGVGLAGSTKGISYQLYLDGGTPIGDPIQGTGNALDFGPQNQVGVYTIVGKSACGDSYMMPGSATIVENPLPVAKAESNAPICLGTDLNLTASGGISYSWIGPNGFTSTEQNPTIPDFTSDGVGTYIVTVTDDKLCSAPAIAEVTLKPGGATGGKISSVSVCYGESGSLQLSGNSNAPDRWETTTDSTSAIWSKITNTTTIQNFSAVTVPIFFRAVVSDGCGNVYSDTATVSIHNYWTGTKSEDWNTKANWSDGQLPSSSSCPDVYIPSGTTFRPVLNNTQTASVTNIHIENGATMKVDNGIMQIGGSIDNKGVFDATNGTLEFNGFSPQSINGSTFEKNLIKNIVVSNNSLTITGSANDTLKISGVVDFGNNSANLITGDKLTLLSTKDNTASIGIVGSGNSISGKVEIERYINIGTESGNHAKAWQFLATPANGQTLLQSWMENKAPGITGYGAQFTGSAGKGFDNTSVAPSVKYWDETVGNWKEIADANTQLFNPRGYFAFIRGDRTVDGVTTKTATATTLRSKGTILTGPQSFSVPAISTTPGNTFFSIGNPYPSAVDLTKVKTGSNEPLLYIYVWNPSVGGSYGVGGWNTYHFNGTHYAPVPDDGSGTDFIQSGQAFLVQEDNVSTTTINFNENNKVPSSSIAHFRQQNIKAGGVQLVTNLFVQDAHKSIHLVDGTLQRFDENFDNKINGLDARKIFNAANNFSIKTDNENLVVECRSLPTNEDTIFYNIANLTSKNYLLKFEASGFAGSGLEGFVEDSYLKTKTPVNLEGNTSFDVNITSDKASSAPDRFRVVFKKTEVLPVKFVSVTAAFNDSEVQIKWQVVNEHSVKLYELQKSIDGINFTTVGTLQPNHNGVGSYQDLDRQPNPGDAYYQIRIDEQNGSVSYSSIVKLFIPYGKPSIGIYPNPITDGIIHLQFRNQRQGRYGIRLLNPLGQSIITKQIESVGGNWTENVKWNFSLPHGVYQLEILKPDGNIQVIKVVY